MTLDRNNPQPLHIQLERILLEDIESGKYAEGGMLPKEVELQELYGVSRITVRRALQNITDKGYLKRTRRKGTFVKPTPVSEPLLKIKSFTQEMLDKGMIPTTSYAHIEKKIARGEIAQELGIEEGVMVIHLTRVRCVQQRPIVLFDTYLKTDLPLVLDDTQYYGSLYDMLENRVGVVIKKITQHITAGLTNKLMIELLHCEAYEPVLILKRTAYSQSGEPVEYTVGRYLADRYEYYFELQEN